VDHADAAGLTMRIDVTHRPAYAVAVAHLDAGEEVQGEPGALIAMDGDVTVDTTLAVGGKGLLGNVWAGLKRMAAGESLRRNSFRSARGGDVFFAPLLVGDIAVIELTEALIVQSGAWICSPPTVSLDASWAGARGFFAGEGLVMLKATGTGPLALHAFGAMRQVDVDGSFVVDTGHIVAFDATLSYKVRPFGGGIFSFLFGGEGLVCVFQGKGRLWLQTRNPTAFGQSLSPLLPMRSG
jgi:uncharacterized protein (TIGR00266 family)